MLDIYVGETARKEIEQNGLTQQMFDVFLGASGGPKWFTLLGLDQYLFGEFFKHRSTELNLVGSSAGAFRSACFTQADPVSAITELATRYSETNYVKGVTAQELTDSAQRMLRHIFSSEGINQLISNPIFKAHFIVAKSNGLVKYENKLLQGLGLAKSILLNRLDRKYLNQQYQRYVFAPQSSSLRLTDPHNINTCYQSFSQDNVEPSLLASGAIPFVMAGIKDIANAEPGMYRDGGVIDYHFELEFNKPGLTLYPHFNKSPKAGWFDKSLARSPNTQHYDKTLMLVPSDQFIANLPYGKIPDRKDFESISYEDRLKYWRTVFSESQRLAEKFDNIIKKQDFSQFKSFAF